MLIQGTLTAIGSVWWFLPLAYLVMSLVAFVAYGMDKAAAQSGQWRTSEAALLMLGLLCGWPGALVAQQLFRHKTRKQPFRALFFASIAVNVATVAWIVVMTADLMQ